MKQNLFYYLSMFFVFLSFACVTSFFSCAEKKSVESKIQKARVKTQNDWEVKPVNQLSQDIILKYSNINSCYLPLLKDSSFYNPNFKVGFDWSDLFNDILSIDSEYRNRYLVGDLMTLDENLESRGIKEKNPDLSKLIDFKKYDNKLFELFDKAEQSEDDKKILFQYIRKNYPNDTIALNNFYEKVWRFKTPPYQRKFSVMRNKVYASGQRICLCEAYRDTLLLVAQYATSSKRLTPIIDKDSSGNTISTKHIEYLPIEKRRSYYASLYRITSKNWETDRVYENADMVHDNKVGGGNQRITFYKGNAQLPNFLLMEPSIEYPKAMRSNGIHEVALRELSRGMLGTANSIGCIRLSDFGSKFTRWWIPQSANFFILYKENRYHKELSKEDIQEELPFRNEKEGNLFREWLHNEKPLKAKQLDVDIDGSFDNGFILDAYNLYGEEYEKKRK